MPAKIAAGNCWMPVLYSCTALLKKRREAASLFSMSESYPDLKANQNFQQLQAELTDIENKLAASRRFFNSAVQEYNTGIQQFPAAIFAGMFGFSQRTFFDLGDQRATLEQAPNVKF